MWQMYNWEETFARRDPKLRKTYAILKNMYLLDDSLFIGLRSNLYLPLSYFVPTLLYGWQHFLDVTLVCEDAKWTQLISKLFLKCSQSSQPGSVSPLTIWIIKKWGPSSIYIAPSPCPGAGAASLMSLPVRHFLPTSAAHTPPRQTPGHAPSGIHQLVQLWTGENAH